jgi:hypothetical protein
MTLAILVALSQIADGLAYQLAQGHGTELNPGAATVIASYGPLVILGVKMAAAVVLGVGAYAMLRRDKGRSALTWLAVIGFVGCFTELLAIA